MGPQNRLLRTLDNIPKFAKMRWLGTPRPVTMIWLSSSFPQKLQVREICIYRRPVHVADCDKFDELFGIATGFEYKI